MKLHAFGVNSSTRAATATLVLVLFCVLGGVPAQATVPDVGYSDVDGGVCEISDPLFAFLLALAYGASTDRASKVPWIAKEGFSKKSPRMTLNPPATTPFARVI